MSTIIWRHGGFDQQEFGAGVGAMGPYYRNGYGYPLDKWYGQDAPFEGHEPEDYGTGIGEGEYDAQL
jgi:hypothetical protein